MKHMYRLLLYINLMCFFIAQTAPISPVRKLVNWARYGSETGRMADVVAHLKRNWGKYAALTAAVVAATQRKRIANAGRRFLSRQQPSITSAASTPLEASGTTALQCVSQSDIFEQAARQPDEGDLNIAFTPEGGAPSEWTAKFEHNRVMVTNSNERDLNAPVDHTRAIRYVAKKWTVDSNGTVKILEYHSIPLNPTAPVPCNTKEDIFYAAKTYPGIEIQVQPGRYGYPWNASYDKNTDLVTLRSTVPNIDPYPPVDSTTGWPAATWTVGSLGTVCFTEFHPAYDFSQLNKKDLCKKLGKIDSTKERKLFIYRHPTRPGQPWPYILLRTITTPRRFRSDKVTFEVLPYCDSFTNAPTVYRIEEPGALEFSDREPLFSYTHPL